MLFRSPLVNLSFGPQAHGPFPDRTGEHCAPQFRRFLRLERPGPCRLSMLPWGLSCLSVLGAVGTALLGAGLLLSLAQHLWTLRWTLSRDRASALPLPKGSMGWPFRSEEHTSELQSPDCISYAVFCLQAGRLEPCGGRGARHGRHSHWH